MLGATKKYEGLMAAGYLLLFAYFALLRPAPVQTITREVAISGPSEQVARLAGNASRPARSAFFSSLTGQMVRWISGHNVTVRDLLVQSEETRFRVDENGGRTAVRGEVRWQVRGGLLGKLVEQALDARGREAALDRSLQTMHDVAEREVQARNLRLAAPARASSLPAAAVRPARRSAPQSAALLPALDRDLVQGDLGIAGPRDFRYQFLPANYVPENRVLPRQPRRRDLGDKELAPVRVGPGISHSQQPGPVEAEPPDDFILKAVAGAARAVPEGVATLDHELGDHPVEDGAIVQGPPCAVAGCGVTPFPLTRGQLDEIRDGFRRLRLVKFTDDVTQRSLKRGVETLVLRFGSHPSS